jgi:hypothetical protein
LSTDEILPRARLFGGDIKVVFIWTPLDPVLMSCTRRLGCGQKPFNCGTSRALLWKR